MHALYLPGNSPENREVTYELAAAVKGFETSTVLEYPHWNSNTGFNLDKTCDDLVSAFAGRGGDFIVIAKSIGVNVCLRAQTISNAFDPRQVVFIGAAINEHAREAVPVDSWLEGYSTPSLWIQQRQDPTLSAEGLEQYLESISLNDRELVVMEGSAHEYDAEVTAAIIGQHVTLS